MFFYIKLLAFKWTKTHSLSLQSEMAQPDSSFSHQLGNPLNLKTKDALASLYGAVRGTKMVHFTSMNSSSLSQNRNTRSPDSDLLDGLHRKFSQLKCIVRKCTSKGFTGNGQGNLPISHFPPPYIKKKTNSRHIYFHI